MSTTRKVALNTVAQIIGRVIFLIISVISIAATTRYLGTTKFGYFTTATAYVAVLTIFTDLGLSVYLIKEWAARDRHDLLAHITGLKLVLGILTGIIGAIIFHLLPYSPEAKQATDLMLIGLISSSITISWLSVFQAELRTPITVYWDTIGRFISLLLLFYSVGHDYGLAGVVTAGVVGPFISAGLYYISLRRYKVPVISLDRKTWPGLLWTALPLGVVGILNTLYFRFDMFMLSLMKPASDVGVYGVSYKVYETISMFGSFFVIAAFPVLSKHAVDNKERLRLTAGKAFDFLILIGIPATVGVILLAKPIIKLVGGAEFLATTGVHLGISLNGVIALQFLAASIWISFMIMLMGQVFIAEGLTKQLLRTSFLALIFNIILNFILIPPLTYLGAAISTSATELMIYWLFRRNFTKHLGFVPKGTIFWKVSMAATIMALAVLGLERYGMYVAAIGGFIVYGISILVVRAVRVDQIKEMAGM